MNFLEVANFFEMVEGMQSSTLWNLLLLTCLNLNLDLQP